MDFTVDEATSNHDTITGETVRDLLIEFKNMSHDVTNSRIQVDFGVPNSFSQKFGKFSKIIFQLTIKCLGIVVRWPQAGLDKESYRTGLEKGMLNCASNVRLGKVY